MPLQKNKKIASRVLFLLRLCQILFSHGSAPHYRVHLSNCVLFSLHVVGWLKHFGFHGCICYIAVAHAHQWQMYHSKACNFNNIPLYSINFPFYLVSSSSLDWYWHCCCHLICTWLSPSSFYARHNEKKTKKSESIASFYWLNAMKQNTIHRTGRFQSNQ